MEHNLLIGLILKGGLEQYAAHWYTGEYLVQNNLEAVNQTYFNRKMFVMAKRRAAPRVCFKKKLIAAFKYSKNPKKNEIFRNKKDMWNVDNYRWKRSFQPIFAGEFH